MGLEFTLIIPSSNPPFLVYRKQEEGYSNNSGKYKIMRLDKDSLISTQVKP